MIYQYAIYTENIACLDEVSELLELISDERKSRIFRFRFMKDRVHSLFAEIILRYALWEQYDLGRSQIQLQYTSYGKPYLDYYKDIYFNLSHSGSWVLCGIGNMPLGVDVELIEEKDLSIAYKIYTKEECDFIFSQSREDITSAFYQIWTLKESYIKNVGQGLSIPFDSFYFQFKDSDIELYVNGKRDYRFSFYSSQLDNRHCTALCVNTVGQISNENIRILTIKEILEWNENTGGFRIF